MAQIDVIKKTRIEKREKMTELGWDPYAVKFDKKHSVAQCLESENQEVYTAGRIMSLRTHGNITFAHLKDESGKIQLFFKKDTLGDEPFKNLKLLDIGDFIGVKGTVGKTEAGEISIIPTDYTMLSKSLQPLPNEWHGVKDIETRYRQRYLDLILNDEVRERFNARTLIIRYLRHYLDDLGFWEVETPVLQPLYGGTNAKPFLTHLNALGVDMFLRIAPELYLKRLIVGGYEKVYEIARNFRNEGIDKTHNPEFSMVEWYEAYADYQRVMDVAEGAFKFIAEKLTGGTIVTVGDVQVDIGKSWPRIKMLDLIKDRLQIDADSMSQEELVEYCKKEHIEMIGGESKGQLIFTIFDEKLAGTLMEPTWITDYPADVSPLAKNHPGNEEWVQRFEGYIGGKELCDGWSEINNPEVQRDRFMKDMTAVRKQDDEAQIIDEDFLSAMEYGMPPLGGIGLGIDRLVMFFTNTWVIKEVLLFPTLRPEKEVDTSRFKDNAGKKIDSIPVQPMLKVHTSSAEMTITREVAMEILTTHLSNKNLINHCKAVEASMGALGQYFREKRAHVRGDEDVNTDMWMMAGLLHDADWEATQNDPSQHTLKTIEWLREKGEENTELIECILSHNCDHNGFRKPQSDMEWALFTCDELTGLIVATALVKPDKSLASVDVESVLSKMKSKGFSKGVDRERITLCEEVLNISLNDFIKVVLGAMQDISEDLGL